MTPPLEAAWVGLVDDAAIFPPGDAPLPAAVEAHLARRTRPYADLVGSFVVTDVRVPELAASTEAATIPLSVVVTGGAGAIGGAVRLATRAGARLAGIEIALRDPDDLPGNARRVVAALGAAHDDGLALETPVYVELPAQAATTGWLAAADVVAESELRLKFRTGGQVPEAFPDAATLAGWIDAALDRETPFKCTAGLHRAVRDTRDGFEQHGFVNLLLATRLAFDGAAPGEVVATLERRDAVALASDALAADLAGARRWFTSFGSCSVTEPLDDLITLGLTSTRPTNERMP